MQDILNFFNNFKINILPEKGPWTAILLIPVIIISGAYWNSIPFYIVLATIWISQRNSDIPLNWTIFLIISIGFSLFIVARSDLNFWIYSFKIIGCFILVSSIRPTLESRNRVWIDIFFLVLLVFIWGINSLKDFGRMSFDMGFGRTLPNWTAVYCFLFIMLAVRWRLPLSLIASLIIAWLTQSRNFGLAIGFVGIGYLFLPFLRFIFAKTSRLALFYILLVCLSLWVLELISTKKWDGYHFFDLRMFRFVYFDTARLDWNIMALKEWTKNLETFSWGMGDWPNEGPNPHHSIIHTLLERGLFVTSILFLYIMNEIRKHSKGMEPWLLGWFSLSMYLHLNFVTMFWVLLLIIIRCRYSKDKKYFENDFFVEWVLIWFKKWKTKTHL